MQGEAMKKDLKYWKEARRKAEADMQKNYVEWCRLSLRLSEANDKINAMTGRKR